MSTVRERDQCLRLKAAELLMHKPDAYLMRMHTTTGPEWFVVKSGPVRALGDQELRGCADAVRPAHDLRR